MEGKVCLVTGATAGIGLVTALELARQGARVIGVGRSPERCAEAARQIREQTGTSAVEFLVADLSSQAEVRRLANQVKAATGRLDVLVNNAGLIRLEREVTVDGLEMTFALNHLAYFLLTNLLLDTVKASTPARIVSVASAAHQGCKMNFDDLQGETKYSPWRAYQQSKLANILFTRELARRLEGTGVTANALHPGYVRTQIFRAEGFSGLAACGGPPNCSPSRPKRERRPRSTWRPHPMWRDRPGSISSGGSPPLPLPSPRMRPRPANFGKSAQG